MSTPTYPSKRWYAAGTKKGGLWGTAVALGATDGILINTDGNPQLKQPYVPHDDIDAIMPLDGDLGPVGAIDFSPDFDFRYDPGALGRLIAVLFGTAGAPAAQYIVNAGNKYIDFDEAGGELTGTLTTGTYTGAALATEIAVAMNAAPGKALTYACTYSSGTNKFTISAGSNFTIRWNTGTHKATDISTLCGYSDAANDTGDKTYTSDTAGVGSAYKHTLVWADENSNFFIFAVERPGKIWEVASCVPYKLGLKIKNGFLGGSISLRGDTVIDTSVINTDTQMAALTYADRANRIKFSHGTIWMNAQSGAALQASDALEVSDIDISYERTIDDVHVAGSTKIVQPREKGFKINVTLTMPRAAAANIAQTDFLAETPQKMLFTFTGKAIATLYNYSMLLYFPRLKYIDVPEAPLADVMTTKLKFQAEEAATGPAGMTAFVRPAVELTNLQTTDYLA